MKGKARALDKHSFGKAAAKCHASVHNALCTTLSVQRALAGSGCSDLDRLAINSAVEHLERALAELNCFVPREDMRWGLKCHG